MFKFLNSCSFVISDFIWLGSSNHVFKAKLTFGAGIYTGMYITQNYDVPRVDEPSKLVDKLKEFADDHRKKYISFPFGDKKEEKKIVPKELNASKCGCENED